MCEDSLLESKQATKSNEKKEMFIIFIKSQQTHIVFLQETHLTDSEAAKLKIDWVDQIYHRIGIHGIIYHSIVMNKLTNH